ncbi:hypothetical protein [Paraburkholderia sp. EG304]|uniref:hypothetical protein n=1 Tax=Paraburkholderia sp. EG304 TaxID=3237015 RepID=UPI003977FACD
MAKHRSAADRARKNDAYLSEIQDFIEKSRSPLTSNVPWRTGELWDPVWYCSFGNRNSFEIDWRISLDNGVSLCERTVFSEQLRTWVCAQTHPSVTGLPFLNPVVASQAISEALRLADYFILYHPADELAQYGFASLSEGELFELLALLASNSETRYSIYRWPERLLEFVNDLVEQTLTDADIRKHKKEFPEISFVGTAPEDWLLPFESDEQVVHARIALLKNDFYKRASLPKSYQYSPHYLNISGKIYANTLRGKTKRVIHAPELAWGKDAIVKRERSSVFVRQDNEGAPLSERTLLGYCYRLKTLSSLPHIDGKPSAPSPAVLSTLNSKNIRNLILTTPAGRFKSIPTAHIYTAVRSAITFFLEHADHLLESYISISLALLISGNRPSILARNFDITQFLERKTVDCGITSYSISRRYGKDELAEPHRGYIKSKEYFARLRKNEGLVDCIRVLYGAIAVTLGALVARRRSENTRLHADEYLDETETFLITHAAKTGYGIHRQKLAIPVPLIVARMLNRLEKFQRDLIKQRLLDEPTELLSFPSLFQPGALVSSSNIEAAIDCFLDYIEMSCDEEGRRYYLRFHPLRRFFPQTFMESGLPNAREILSEFLGHTNPEEVWTYLLEVCPGDAIERAAAQTATAQLRDGNEAYAELAALVRATFGVGDFWALSDEQMNGYVLRLLRTGEASVTMEYLHTSDGVRHRMLMKVKESGDGKTT